MKNHQNLEGKRVLVTGATGFIGSRMVELLFAIPDIKVRVLVSNISNLSPVARFPIEIVKGDITDPEIVMRAADGCDFVFHCAYGNKGSRDQRMKINFEGTKNIVSACLDSGVKHLVCLSTIMVYGNAPEGEIDESSPRQKSGGAYADSKIMAEKLVEDAINRDNLPATILQPTAVYGPKAPVWSVNILNQLQNGRVMLVDEGQGLCNCVYIDDLIQAMMLSITRKEAAGETFIISGEEVITWKEYYGYFEEMLGYNATVNIPEAEAIARYSRQHARKSLLKVLKEDQHLRSSLMETPFLNNLRKAMGVLVPPQAMQSLKSRVAGNASGNGLAVHSGNSNGNGSGSKAADKPVHLLSPDQIAFYKSKPVFRIEKAKKQLGYQPVTNLKSGMKITEEWARYANLLGEDQSILSELPG